MGETGRGPSGGQIRSADDGAGPRASWHVLIHRDLRWYFAGNVCSNLGTWLQNTAQILLAFQLSGSALGVGLVTGAQFASPLVLGPWAGLLADRLDRRCVLLATHAASAVIAGTMAGLQFTGQLTLPLLVAGAAGIGIAFTFTLPALSALVPMLVPETEIKAAMAMNAVSFNVGRALAPVLGVGMIGMLGFGWAFVLNAVSFVVLGAVLLSLRPRPAAQDPRTPRLLDGLRIAVGERRILIVLVMVALVTVATDPPLVLGPSFARDAFGLPASWSAYFLGALGAGTIVGSFLPSPRPTLRRAGAYLGLLGFATTGFAFAPNVWVAIGAAALAGAAALLAGAATQTLLLALSGPHRAGRVMAVWTVAFAGSRPIATAADTWLEATVGARIAALLLALPGMLVASGILCLRVSSRGQEWALRILRESTIAGPVPAVSHSGK